MKKIVLLIVIPYCFIGAESKIQGMVNQYFQQTKKCNGNCRDGFGTLHLGKNGLLFRGHFVKGKPEGHGVLLNPDGEFVITGFWHGGRLKNGYVILNTESMAAVGLGVRDFVEYECTNDDKSVAISCLSPATD